MRMKWREALRTKQHKSSMVGAEQNVCSLIGSSPPCSVNPHNSLECMFFNCSFQARNDDTIVAPSRLLSVMEWGGGGAQGT